MASFKKMGLKFYLPLIVLFLMGAFLLRGLWLDPQKLPSVFINKPLPAFELPILAGVKNSDQFAELSSLVSNQTLQGKPWVLNVFASWCQACVQEHHYLMQIAQKNQITLVGLAFNSSA